MVVRDVDTVKASGASATMEQIAESKRIAKEEIIPPFLEKLAQGAHSLPFRVMASTLCSKLTLKTMEGNCVDNNVKAT